MSSNANKDGKNIDKGNAIRSKHSVTEQRRRSKINERFQMLRNLVPNTDQKRDTASFLLEVIEHVQYLQEKVQKYEVSYQGWSSEPTKLMPWSVVGHQQAVKNGSGTVSTFAGKFHENNINITPAMIAQNPLESDPIRDTTAKAMDRQHNLANKGMRLPFHGDNMLVQPLERPASEAQSTDCLISSDSPHQQGDLIIEGGTISISSVYSQGLLTSLTQALRSAGLDLSQANISVQINLGKRANRGIASGASTKDPQNSPNQAMNHLRDLSSGEDSNHAHKRLKK